MQKNMKLLPHSWNIISITFILTWLIVYQFSHLWPGLHLAQQLSPYIQYLVTIALVIACFSREKVEDEMINSFRLKAVAWTAIIWFTLKILSFILFDLKMDTDLVDELTDDFSIVVFTYLLLFKIRIFVENKRLAHDKQS